VWPKVFNCWFEFPTFGENPLKCRHILKRPLRLEINHLVVLIIELRSQYISNKSVLLPFPRFPQFILRTHSRLSKRHSPNFPLSTSETSVSFYQGTGWSIPQDTNIISKRIINPVKVQTSETIQQRIQRNLLYTDHCAFPTSAESYNNKCS
jgi:hypothetical protein